LWNNFFSITITFHVLWFTFLFCFRFAKHFAFPFPVSLNENMSISVSVSISVNEYNTAADTWAYSLYQKIQNCRRFATCVRAHHVHAHAYYRTSLRLILNNKSARSRRNGISPLLISFTATCSALRSYDKLLLPVHRKALALSAKAFALQPFGVSSPSVWNSLSFDCRSA